MNALPLLLDPTTLSNHLGDDKLLIVDLSSSENYQQGHIPGAINADPKGLLRGEGPVPNKLPTTAQLSAYFSKLGLTADHQVVVYDDQMGAWAGRLLWTLDILGHRKTAVLDGQLPAWTQAGFALETHQNLPSPGQYQAELQHPELMADMDYILQHLDKPDTQVWDARSIEEYRGEKQINCQKPGHIPGAHSFDWARARVSSNELQLKPLEQLKAELAAAGITADKEIITHCQTHRRSGFTYLAAKALGFPRIRCYDGSWFEWGNHPDTPVDVS